MAKLDVMFEESFREPLTSLELADVVGDGKNELVISTLNGDIRVFSFHLGKKPRIKEVAKTGGLPPVAAFSVGDILGNGSPDFVVGGLDNFLRVLVYLGGKLEVRGITPVGTLPTALMVANVVDDPSAEVLVATNDKALRCYGWYDVVLDKLAHKVVERPVFSIQPLNTKNLPYSRFVFGDDSGYLYLYQYADDRLHEISKIRIGGEVNLVATGNITGSRYDEIAAVSNGKDLTLLSFEQQSFEKTHSKKVSNNIASIRMGHLLNDSEKGQIVLSLCDSNIVVLDLADDELIELASVKTKSKARESMIAFGDVTGDSNKEIVQAVGNDLLILSLNDE